MTGYDRCPSPGLPWPSPHGQRQYDFGLTAPKRNGAGPRLPGPGCYWTTSSARRRSEGGSVNPRADAAFMLMDR